MSPKQYDSIIVGAGHAGAEASLALARMGARVLLVTINIDTICQMSCNPAIGGLAKGHIVREIDALGGEMALAIDATGIQFRMLNKSKGPAVWAPRAQADKKKYHLYMKKTIQSQPGLDLREDMVESLIVKDGAVKGVRTAKGAEFLSKTVILTTGTHLGGVMHIGGESFAGGRAGEASADKLPADLKKHGLKLVRFKTGTPARLMDRSVNFSALKEQRGDEPPLPFSFRTEDLETRQICCHITYTNRKTHDIIRKNIHRSPLYGGKIKGIGARYCPSIEDKVMKFPEKEKHQLYLEPEGLDVEEIYINGLSTSLPKDVQAEIIKSVPGLEKAEILRWAYAIEYDVVLPTQLKKSLETKSIRNLYLAGQINGTSGYEEAAAQGLMAALNAMRKLRCEDEFILLRSEAYIGVMIDDLVTLGVTEPYRMFTSRAEYRLLLRQDNADDRLLRYGHSFGLINEGQYSEHRNSLLRIERDSKRLKNAKIGNKTLFTLLSSPGIEYEDLPLLGEKEIRTKQEEFKVTLSAKYEGYIRKQESSVKNFEKLEKQKIPKNTDFFQVNGIKRETKEKLNEVRPETFGQAARIPGITRCDLSVLMIWLEKQKLLCKA